MRHNTEPCGTPLVTVRQLDRRLFISTHVGRERFAVCRTGAEGPKLQYRLPYYIHSFTGDAYISIH